LLLQVWAQKPETLVVPGFVADPVEDSCATQVEGILQKYAGRILVMPTGACAIHCRHCFRRSFPYESLQTQGLALRLQEFLAHNADVEEVILSGGDPLLLDDESLSVIFAVIAMAPHVRRLRIHTRLPIVLPSRFTQTLLETIKNLPCEMILVVHANHANELDEASALVFARLRSLGVHLLNQSVLLRGVNDCAQVLTDLSRKLFAQGVLPYYLHQLDRAAGTAHFEVSVSEGLAIMEKLGAMLPGYLVPRYVREVPGASGKTILVKAD